MDAAFRWTEEHSKRIRVELTVRKEVNSGIFQEQTFEVEYVVHWVQCDDCKKEFTPHTWASCIQVRQRAEHKKTFLYLEQVMLKLGVTSKTLKIEEEPDGLNFFFRSKNHGQQLLNFFQSMVPYKMKDSKELISHDIHTGVADYKYTTILEMPKICKDDLIILPLGLAKELGGVNSLGVCYKVSQQIHCYDPVTLRCYEISSKQYFSYEEDLVIVPFRGQETKFMIQDIQEDKHKASMINTTFSNIKNRFAHVEVMKECDGTTYCCHTHLGHILKHGDVAVGFDIRSINCTEDLESLKNQKSLPDVILVRKHYDEKYRKKKIWKQNRLDIEENEFGGKRKKYETKKKVDQEEFEMEIEQNKEYRKNINLYRDEEAIKLREIKKRKKETQKNKVVEDDERDMIKDEDEWETDSEDYEKENPEMVQIEDLLAGLNLDEKNDEDLDKDVEDLLADMDNFKMK